MVAVEPVVAFNHHQRLKREQVLLEEEVDGQGDGGQTQEHGLILAGGGHAPILVKRSQGDRHVRIDA